MARKGENITKRKDGRWEARVIYGRDENGRAKYRYLYAKTYTEVRAKKEYLQSQIITCASQIQPNTMTVNDMISQFLLHKATSVKESTMAHYRHLIQHYIRKPLGSIRLLQLSVETIETFTQHLLKNGKRTGEGLSDKTVRDILSLLKSMLRYAVSQNQLPATILNFTMPRIVNKSIAVLEPEEQSRLESFLLDGEDSYRFGSYLCLYTGLRIGEVCSLKWSDIDLSQSVLFVNRTIQRISISKKTTRIVITEPKTRTSLRAIPIPQFLLQLLSQKREQITDEEAYLLTGTQNYIEPSNYYMRYKRWLHQLNLPSYSFHALRHTFATRCIEMGFDPKSLSEILGHADVNITLNRYVHPSLDLKRSHMERLTPKNFQSEKGSEIHRKRRNSKKKRETTIRL